MSFKWTLPSEAPESYRTIHKFGRNPSVGTSFELCSIGGLYPMPQPASATTLRIKAGNTNDTAAGTGAREVTFEGLDSAGKPLRASLATAGLSASSATSVSFMRLYRAWVSACGAYEDGTGNGGQAADITIENGAGGTDWLTISATDRARGQSECGCYTIPYGYVGYIVSLYVGVESNKTADLVLFQRKSILDAAAPYEAPRMVIEFPAVANASDLKPETPLGPFSACTDLITMTKAATSASVTFDMEIVLTPEGTHIPEAYDHNDPLS